MTQRLGLLLGICLLLTAGCGSKGDLYLPPAEQAAHAGQDAERDQ